MAREVPYLVLIIFSGGCFLSLTHKAVLNTCIIVLGMHRSGTSALAGALNMLGLYVGDEDTLISASEDINPKGFWEHAGIVDLHERLLAVLGSSWNDERSLPERWWLLPHVQPFRQELSQVIRTEFMSAGDWGIKDPRMCRLMPLWREILEDIGCSPRVVMILRDPREVAKSLSIRDGISEERSALLWLRHVLEAERWTRGYPRTIVTFEGLLEDWQGTIERIDTSLELKLNLHDIAVQQRVEEFIEPSLKHHRTGMESSSGGITVLALSAYRACIASQEPEDLEFNLAKTESQVSELMNLIVPWSEEIQELKHQLNLRYSELAGLNNEIARIKGTVSWRITAPLRGFWNLFLKVRGKKK